MIPELWQLGAMSTSVGTPFHAQLPLCSPHEELQANMRLPISLLFSEPSKWVWLAFCTVRTHSWFILNLPLTRTSQIPFHRAAFQLLIPHLVCICSTTPFRMKNLALALVKLWAVSDCPASKLWRSLCKASLPPRESITSLYLEFLAIYLVNIQVLHLYNLLKHWRELAPDWKPEEPHQWLVGSLITPFTLLLYLL